MTKYYLLTPEELEGHTSIEAKRLDPRMLILPMKDMPVGAAVIILAYVDTAIKQESPIQFESNILPKRGRPLKRKTDAQHLNDLCRETPLAEVVIESCMGLDGALPDELWRVSIIGKRDGKPFRGTGSGETRQDAVRSALVLAGFFIQADVKQCVDTPAKKAVMEALA